jgi:5-methyltetrahydropteroyltriglutamate--homocysteine methyltransferase
MHLCWGNYEGPHTHDIPLAKILDVCMRARPAGLSFEAANPRHAHEWGRICAAQKSPTTRS